MKSQTEPGVRESLKEREELGLIGSKGLSKIRLEDILNCRSAANAAEPIERMPIPM